MHASRYNFLFTPCNPYSGAASSQSLSPHRERNEPGHRAFDFWAYACSSKLCIRQPKVATATNRKHAETTITPSVALWTRHVTNPPARAHAMHGSKFVPDTRLLALPDPGVLLPWHHTPSFQSVAMPSPSAWSPETSENINSFWYSSMYCVLRFRSEKRLYTRLMSCTSTSVPFLLVHTSEAAVII